MTMDISGNVENLLNIKGKKDCQTVEQVAQHDWQFLEIPRNQLNKFLSSLM